jgi:hypothetical protein
LTVGGRPRRGLGRLLVLVATASLLIGLAHGASAAPVGQGEATVDEIRRQVSEIRGLPILAETPVVSLPHAALVGRLAREVSSDHAVREYLTSQMLLEVLGAMPRGFDLRELQLRLLDEQTVAVYDFDERRIYLDADAVSGDGLSTNERLTVAHEVTHTLQDQHFSLKRLLPAEPENSDVELAARALVEGDAMLTMRIWGRQYLRPSDKRALGDDASGADPVLDSAPPLVRGELLFPYDDGWVFAQLLYQDGGFAAVDRAFQRPPRSTEQILHPEKYAAGETPRPVTLPPLERILGGTWQNRRTDVFGELVLRLLLEPSVGWPTAEAAADGWGGDAYTILEDSQGRRVVGIVTVWDSEGDAAEMYNAFVDSIPALYTTTQRRTIALPSMARWTTPDYQIQALKTDNVVRLVYAPDVPTLELVEAQLADAVIGPAGPIAPRPASATPPPPPPTPTPQPTQSAPPGPPGQPAENLPPALGPASPEGRPTPQATPSEPAEPSDRDQPPDDGQSDDD